MLAAGFFPWWGIVEDLSAIPYNTKAGTDLGLWVAGDWQLQILPGAVYRQGTSSFWWEYTRDHPEFTGYGAAAASGGALWSLALLAGGRALTVRFRPQSRRKGLPTALEVVAAAAGGFAVAVTAIGFPAGTGFSFVGAEGRLSWGPHVGWFMTLAGVGLISCSAMLGWSADRSLKGRCWKCYQATSARVCDYCKAAQ